IGVLATKGTFKGRLYQETTSKYASNIKVCYRVGSGLVELVEQGKSNSEEAKDLLKKYVNPMLQESIDHLVLGCTHYPFFIPILKEILPESIDIIDPAPAVAKQTNRIIGDNNCDYAEKPFVKFFSSGSTQTLKNLVSEIEQGSKITFRNKEFIEYPL
ncbi:MAG TPA: glutamate racemase, partial [Bacteroidetes bacterium]|nr:glutamate racemase [Bacteroidota bacterium]